MRFVENERECGEGEGGREKKVKYKGVGEREGCEREK
jgi:hypothetical protein